MAQPNDINAVSPVLQDSQRNAPRNADSELIQMLMDMQAEGARSRQRYDTDWPTYWKYYHDKQWDDQSRAAYRAKPVINIIRQTIQSQIPILTDNKPGFDVIPPEPSDFEFANILSMATKNWWEKYHIESVIVDGLLDAMVSDIGIYKTVWDEELEGGAGDIKITAIDPSEVWVNRDATDFTREAGWKFTIHRMYKSVGCLKALFPDLADKITPDDSSSKSEDDRKGKESVTFVSPTDRKDTRGQSAPGNTNDDRKTCEVWECWLDDDTVEEYQNEEDGKKEYKKKFPKGRLITILPNKKVKLQDKENPYNHRNCPFVKVIDNCLPRCYVGEGEARMLIEVQRLLNKTTANIVDYMTLMANAIWKVKQGALDDPGSITNRAGMVLTVNDGYQLNDVEREIPPALPANATAFYELMWDTANKLTGQTELSQGRRTQGDPTAGYAITQLQEAAQTRIRMKERNMQRALSCIGKMVIALMLQYYKAPRMAKLTGEEGWPQYFEYFIEDVGNDKMVMNKREYHRKDTGEYVPEDTYQTTPPSKGVFDVNVLAGSSLPHAKAQRSNTAFKLFEMGIVDEEEVLSTLEWPNKEQIMTRLRQKKQEMAALEQAQLPPPK